MSVSHSKMQMLLATKEPVRVTFVKVWSPILKTGGVWRDGGYFTTRAGAEIYAIGIGPNGTDASVVDHNAIRLGHLVLLLADGSNAFPKDGSTVIEVSNVPHENEEQVRAERLIERAKSKLTIGELKALGIK